MYSQKHFSFRLIWRWCLIFIYGIVTAYLLLIALVSVWVGLGHLDQPGSSIPIVVGLLFFIGLTTFFIRIVRRVLGRLKSPPVVTISPSSPSAS